VTPVVVGCLAHALNLTVHRSSLENFGSRGRSNL
jgi:hypothetical protein